MIAFVSHAVAQAGGLVDTQLPIAVATVPMVVSAALTPGYDHPISQTLTGLLMGVLAAVVVMWRVRTSRDSSRRHEETALSGK